MNFIIPQNYKFNTKILGLIDSQTAVLNAIWSGLVFLIINFIFKSLNIKIFLFIILCFPVLVFSIVGINGENVISVINYIIKFLLRPKLLLYSKWIKISFFLIIDKFLVEKIRFMRYNHTRKKKNGELLWKLNKMKN